MLSQECLDNSPQSFYNNFEKSIEEAALNVVGKINPKKTKKWVSEETTSCAKKEIEQPRNLSFQRTMMPSKLMSF